MITPLASGPLAIFESVRLASLITVSLPRLLLSSTLAPPPTEDAVKSSSATFPAVIAQIKALKAKHGLPVSLIGWSRGGIMVREIARQVPDCVRLVITLGSPFADPTANNVGVIWKWLTGEEVPTSPERIRQLAEPIPVPATAIYTKSDGVVAWRACLEREGEGRENVEVRSTHIGLGFHPPALWVIADRLAQKPGVWKPFKPSKLVAPFFPRKAGVYYARG